MSTRVSRIYAIVFLNFSDYVKGRCRMADRLPRKLAAILYADVAGYSRLTGEDEDETHRTLSDYLDLISTTIQAHHGQVVH